MAQTLVKLGDKLKWHQACTKVGFKSYETALLVSDTAIIIRWGMCVLEAPANTGSGSAWRMIVIVKASVG
jgi:hypothetical protein